MIESKSNAKIKKLAFLSTKKGRKQTGEFLIEGLHMVLEAIKFKFPLSEIFVASSQKSAILPRLEGAMCDITEVIDVVFERVAKTENSQGVVATGVMPKPQSFFGGNRFLVLDRIADPGNMGTILRTAAASGFNNIITIDCVDPFNPKCVRSSSSGIFFVNIFDMTKDEFLKLAKSHIILAATAEGENVFENKTKPQSFGLVIGNEANGVDEDIKAVSKLVALPMDSRVESLNAAVSASILMYFFANM